MENFHGIDEDDLLGVEAEEFKGADGLGVVDAKEPEVFVIEFEVAEEGGLEEVSMWIFWLGLRRIFMIINFKYF